MIEIRPFAVSIIVLLLYPICKGIYNIYFHPLHMVPGPRLWKTSRIPFICHLLKGTLVQRVEQLHQTYGPVLRIAPGEVTFAHPDAWIDILQPRLGRPPFFKDSLWWSEPSPKSLMNAIDPNTHARIRRTLGPAFMKSALRAQEPIIQQYVALLVQRLRERIQAGCDSLSSSSTEQLGRKSDKTGTLVDIFPWLNFTTFDIFGDLGFGESFNCLEHSKYHPWISLIFNSIKAITFLNSVKYYPMFDWLLKKCIPPSMKKMQDDHFQHVVDKVQRRMNWEVSREDIMSHTLKEAKQGKGMTVDEINYTFAGLTIAGSETTATTLGGTLNYLSGNVRVRRRVVAEVRDSFETVEDITLVRVEERCRYLTAVIAEGLRLCPPVPWILPRVVPPGGDYVCGVWLPGGTIVSIQQYALNRSKTFFHDAVVFTPERWLPSAQDPKSPFYNDVRKAVQPFSVGPRSCMGKDLAWAELRLVLAHLLWAFDIEEKDDGSLVWEHLRTFLLVEKRPIELLLGERKL